MQPFSRTSSLGYGLVTLLVTSLLGGSVEAQLKTSWTATDGLWGETANWDNGVPVGQFNALLGPGTGVVTHDVEVNSVSGLVIDSETADLVLDQPLVMLEALDWRRGRISGSGEFDFFGSGQLQTAVLETTFNNFGEMRIGSENGLVRLATGNGKGVWNNRPGSLMDFVFSGVVGTFDGGLEGIVNNKAGALMRFRNAATYILWETNNDGVIEVDAESGQFAGALFVGNYRQTAKGVIRLKGGFVDFFNDVEISGKVTGEGSILNMNSTFDGLLEPGGFEIGHINVAGGLIMTGKTVTNIQIGPNQSADLISNTGGPLQLAGTLNIEAQPGASPGEYTLFGYNNASGLQFEQISFGKTPPGFEGSLFLDQQAQAIKLNVTRLDIQVLLGDLNLDGMVDLGDIPLFVERLSTGTYQEEADINADGTVTIADIPLFVAILAGS